MQSVYAQSAIEVGQVAFSGSIAFDAISSLRAESKGYAMERMTQAGIEFVDTEMVVFE